MRRIILVLALYGITAIASALPLYPVSAPHRFVPSNPYGNQNDPWYLGFGIGADIPARNWNLNLKLGALDDFFVGYQLAPMVSVQLWVEQGFLAGNGLFVENPRCMAEFKLTFVQKGFQPYLFAGPGLGLRFQTTGGDPVTYGDACVGGGFQFDLGLRTHWYMEGRYNFAFNPSAILQDVPVACGLWVGL
jgi:hypothetical protein